MPSNISSESEQIELLPITAEAEAAKPTKRKPRRFERPEGKCQGPDCNKVVPGGLVNNGQKFYFCSEKCKRRQRLGYATRHTIGICEYCDGPIKGTKHRKGKPRFCSKKHENLFHDDRLFGQTGPFRELLKEYLSVTNTYRASNLNNVKLSLAHFFSFVVRDDGITKLEDIGPSTVTRYIAKERSRGLKSRNFVGRLSTFFAWLLMEERVQMLNPVVPRFHSMRGAPPQPRPYNGEDLSFIWCHVESSGRADLMLAFAIGEECGLRVSEVCNVRICDVDPDKQTIFIRTPTKNMMTRTVQYHDKVAKYLALWLKQRNPECQHDNLLHDTRAGYFVGEQLDRHFRNLLSRKPEPAKSFEFHRLRHSWATRLMNGGMEIAILKELGGWVHWNSMQAYIRVLPETIKRQYEESYLKLQEQEEAGTEESLSLLDFVAMDRDTASSHSESAV